MRSTFRTNLFWVRSLDMEASSSPFPHKMLSPLIERKYFLFARWNLLRSKTVSPSCWMSSSLSLLWEINLHFSSFPLREAIIWSVKLRRIKERALSQTINNLCLIKFTFLRLFVCHRSPHFREHKSVAVVERAYMRLNLNFRDRWRWNKTRSFKINTNTWRKLS